MSKSTKNASSQEAFGRTGKQLPMEQSPAVSTADVMSSAIGSGATAVFVVEKAETSAAPPTGGEQDDLCMVDP
jgi:hypothetical protein